MQIGQLRIHQVSTPAPKHGWTESSGAYRKHTLWGHSRKLNPQKEKKKTLDHLPPPQPKAAGQQPNQQSSGKDAVTSRGQLPPAAGQVGARALLGKSLSSEEHLLLLSATTARQNWLKQKGTPRRLTGGRLPLWEAATQGGSEPHTPATCLLAKLLAALNQGS